jgi:hypothetical protein
MKLDAILAEIGGQAVGRSSVIGPYSWFACAAAIVLAADSLAYAQWQGGAPNQGGPVYQRRAFESSPKHGSRKDNKFDHFPIIQSAPVNSGWFQRPYPYHLDYYRMRYGGSYAPYFGNLYGPPQVVTAPPYYGPYYGNLGYSNDGSYGVPLQPPVNMAPTTNDGSDGDSLPAPQ